MMRVSTVGGRVVPWARQAPPGVAPAAPADRVELSAPELGIVPARPSRPWLGVLGLGLALAAGVSALAAPAQAGIHATGDPFSLGDQDFPHHHGSGNWDQQNVPGGWLIPRNSSSVPVQPRFAFPVKEGTADLGPVRILDNTRGKIRGVRLQWPAENDPRARSAHEAMFRDLLTRMDPDVRFQVVAESGGVADLEALLSKWDIPPGKVQIHSLSLHSNREELVRGLSMWSRDSSVTLTRVEDGREILLLPRSFRDDGQVDAYLNRVILQASGAAPAMLESRQPEIVVRRSWLYFEGGDILANGRHVLVSGATVEENARKLSLSPEQVRARFASEFGREVIEISPEPDFHLDMGIGFLDDHTVTVADPDLALSLLEKSGYRGLPIGELSRMKERTEELGLSRKYQLAADLLAARGYRVVRLPNLAGQSLESPYLTYHNVMLENYAGQDGKPVKKVYLPVYGTGALDSFARKAYEKEGFQVVEVPAALLSTRLGGGVRCAVGELDVLN